MANTLIDLNLVLKDQKYTFDRTTDSLTIRDTSLTSSIFVISSFCLGLFFLVFSIIMHQNLYYLSLLLIATGFIYERWKYPKSVTFKLKTKEMSIRYNSGLLKKISIYENPEVKVECDVRASHVSAFEEGNQDFRYFLYYSDSEAKKLKLASFSFRESQDDYVLGMVDYLNTEIKGS
ncbi:MAG: hypothetical protein OCD76_24250 [Reichenbachiella sp.]